MHFGYTQCKQKGPACQQAGFVHILIVILVAATLLSGYFIYQNQPKPTSSPQPPPLSTEAPAKAEDPTANWKTYTNTEYGFYFKHPADWVKNRVGFGEFQNLNVLYDEVIGESPQYQGDFATGLSIRVLAIDSAKSYIALAEEKLAETKKLGYDENPNLYSTKIGSNKNIPAVIVNFSGLTGNAFIAAYTQLAPNKTLIFYGNYPVDSQREIDLFNQVLSTFKFIQ